MVWVPGFKGLRFGGFRVGLVGWVGLVGLGFGGLMVDGLRFCCARFVKVVECTKI